MWGSLFVPRPSQQHPPCFPGLPVPLKQIIRQHPPRLHTVHTPFTTPLNVSIPFFVLSPSWASWLSSTTSSFNGKLNRLLESSLIPTTFPTRFTPSTAPTAHSSSVIFIPHRRPLLQPGFSSYQSPDHSTKIIHFYHILRISRISQQFELLPLQSHASKMRNFEADDASVRRKQSLSNFPTGRFPRHLLCVELVVGTGVPAPAGGARRGSGRCGFRPACGRCTVAA